MSDDRPPALPETPVDAHPGAYPPAERLDLVEHLPAGSPPADQVPVADPYRWLEDDADPRTTTWSAAQDELFGRASSAWGTRDHWAARVRDLLGAGSVGVPAYRGDRTFFTRRTGEQEHAVLVLEEPDGEGGRRERVLVDPVALDPTGTTTMDAWQPSKEGALLAYQLSEGGSEESVLRVLDVATGEVVDGPIDRARYSSVGWLRGGEAFYYVRRLPPEQLPADEEQYHRRVWLHRVGTDPAQDVEVFGAGRPVISYYGAGVSADGRWLVVSAASGTDPRNDVYLADLHAADPATPALVTVAEGLDARTGVHVGRDGRVYVHTDLDAPRGRIAVTDPDDPSPGTWRPLVDERPDAVCEDFAVLDGPDLAEPRLVVSWTAHAVARLTEHDLRTGGQTAEVVLPGLGSVGGLATRLEPGHETWFTYTDHVSTPHVLRYDALDGLVRVHAVPPGVVQAPDVVARQVTYPGADGTDVRMFVVARADALTADGAPRGPAPTILYGYGGFGLSLTPSYSATTLAWVEAGGVWATANLRGGGEEGEAWHRDGMLAHKQNVFDDFHAAAQTLVGQGWTTSDLLTVSGGSNGGLLVGATATQRPDLVRAVLCSAPLLDMVRYQHHGLGVTWTGEYGDAEDPEQLAWLLDWSPYHRAERSGPTRYPAVLFTVFDSDSRVHPLHARKLAAALQHATTSDPAVAPVLVRREGDVGHGARALTRTVDLTADTLAFAAHHTGLDPRTPGQAPSPWSA